MPIRFEPVKRSVLENLPVGHPAREAILLQPDELPEAVFDALLPTWIHLLRLKSVGGDT